MRTVEVTRTADVNVRLLAASIAAAQFSVEGAPPEAIEGFLSDLDHRTFFSDGHSVSVARIVADIHREYGASRDEIARRYHAALLHDIGKVAIPVEILGKPGPLSTDEYEVVKTHAAMGADVVAAVPHLEDLVDEVRHHHERVDGEGYPDGLAGAGISFAAKVLAVADAFDAMTSARVYRGAMPIERAVVELKRSTGTQLDGEIVDALLATLAVSRPT